MPETQRKQGRTCLFQSKNKQLISNFEAEIAVEPKQLEAQPENVVAYRKMCTHIGHTSHRRIEVK